jgi:hypothetical protein
MSQEVNDLNNLAGLAKDQYGSVPAKKKRKWRVFNK